MLRTFANLWLYTVAWAAIAASCIAAGDEQTTRTLVRVNAAAVPATFQQLKPDWSMAFEIDGEQKEFGRSDCVVWGNFSDQDRAPQVLLADGTLLVGEVVRIEAESVAIASRLWGELQIARRLVRACLLLPSRSPLERDRQWQSLRKPEAADRVLLRNGDILAGKLLPTAPRDSAGLFGLLSVGIELSGSGASTSVRMEEVRAMTFQDQAVRAAAAECLLGFRDGSLVVASQLAPAEPNRTRITTAAGARLELRTDEFGEKLTLVQPRNEQVDYLSDLPAVGYKSLPLLALEWPLGVATNTLGGRLRSGGNIIFNGLGMHSAARVAYTLDRKYRSFQAELALDEHAQRRGSVVYRVLVERENDTGQRSWKLDFTSPIIRGGDTPIPIAVDVTDATRLALVVEMADHVDTRDYANWLNARLLR